MYGDVLFLGIAGDHLNGVSDHQRQAVRVLGDLDQAGLDAGDIQDVFDQAAEPLCLSLDHSAKLLDRLGVFGFTIDQHLGIGIDRGQRCLELVRDMADKVVFHLGDLFFAGDIVQNSNHLQHVALAVLDTGQHRIIGHWAAGPVRQMSSS